MKRKLVMAFILLLVAASVSAQIASQTSGAKSGSQKDTGATAIFINTLEEGEVKEFSLNKRALPVNRISFVPVKSVTGDMRIHIRRTYDFPTRTHPRIRDAHSYFEINTVNLKQDYYESVEFHFVIQKSWADVRKLSPDEISLYRLEDSDWKELPTEFVETAGNDLIFRSQSSGFSYFGIAKSKGIAVISDNETAVNETYNETYNETELPGENETTPEEEVGEDLVFDEGMIKDDVRSTLIYWLIIIAIMLVFYILSKKVKNR